MVVWHRPIQQRRRSQSRVSALLAKSSERAKSGFLGNFRRFRKSKARCFETTTIAPPWKMTLSRCRVDIGTTCHFPSSLSIYPLNCAFIFSASPRLYNIFPEWYRREQFLKTIWTPCTHQGVSIAPTGWNLQIQGKLLPSWNYFIKRT